MLTSFSFVLSYFYWSVFKTTPILKKKRQKFRDVNSIVKCYIKLRENEKLWDFDQIQIKAPHLPVISVQLDKATKFSLFYS